MKWRIVPLSVRCSRQTEGDTLLRKGETLYDPQGQGGLCSPQSFVEGCLTLVECLSFADHSRDMPGMVQREAMIGQRQRNGRKCGLTFIRQPSGPIPIRAETAEIRAGDLVSIYGDGRGREGCAHGGSKS